MKFTDIFIRRPVLASVVSLLILRGRPARHQRPAGAAVSAHRRTRSSRSRPPITAPIADLIAGFITTPLEQAIAQADGIDYMTSTSPSGVSTITAYLRLNYDSEQGADRDQHQGQLGAEPAAAGHAAAGARR